MRNSEPVANPCAHCGCSFTTPYGDAKKRRFCSMPCFYAHRRPAMRVCTGCKKSFPFQDFPRMRGKATLSCKDCYRPQGPMPLAKAPAPCKQCKKPFSDYKAKSRMAIRKYCSRACSQAAHRATERLCLACQKVLPLEAFSEDGSYRRAQVCQTCWEARQATGSRGFGYLAPFWQAYRYARDLSRKLPGNFEFSREAAQQLYGTPCDYCGAPGSVFRPVVSGAGFQEHVVGICCWLCAKLVQVRKGGLSPEEVLRHAKAIVRHQES